MFRFLMGKRVKIWYLNGYSTSTIKGTVTKTTNTLITLNDVDLLFTDKIVKIKLLNKKNK